MAINNETRGWWRFFWHRISLKPDAPRYHRYPTHMIDAPYHWANSHILKLHRDGSGIVLGWWKKSDRTEEQALIDAMEGRQMDDLEFSEAEKAHLRRNMIKKQFSADDQALLVEVLDL